MKIQSPWMGRIKGSAGNMTGCKVYDKNVMRAKAFEVSNPNTQAQQTQRNYFALLINLIGTFTDEQLRTLFPQKPKAMSRRNALTKQLAVSNTTEGTTKSIDFADINTLGNAPEYDFGATACTISDGAVTVTLAASVKADTSIADNIFGAALVNETKGEIHYTIDVAVVSDGVLNITAPESWEDTDDINPIPLVYDKKKKDGRIPLVGFGTMGVTKRPNRP